MKKYQETVEEILNLNPHLRAYRRKKLAAFWIRLVLLELVVMAATVYLMSFGLKAAPALGIGLAILLPVFALKPKRTFGMRPANRRSASPTAPPRTPSRRLAQTPRSKDLSPLDGFSFPVSSFVLFVSSRLLSR